MRWHLIAGCFGLWALWAQPLGAKSTPAPSQLVAPLVTSGIGGTVYCSTWKARAAVFITAAHCLLPESTTEIAGTLGHVLRVDPDRDLAAIFAPLPAYTVLMLGTPPSVGATVEAYGYGYAVGPTMLVRHVAHPSLRFQFGPQRWMVFDGSFVPGMSGGPIVDRHDRVVSVVQAGLGTYGLGSPWESLRQFLSGL